MLRTKLKVSQKRQLSVPAAVRIKRLILLILILFTLALAAFFNCSYASEMPASSDAPPSAGRPADPEKLSSALLESGKNAEEKRSEKYAFRPFFGRQNRSFGPS
jgi:hypothetical protein